jgi:hypothetical protein
MSFLLKNLGYLVLSIASINLLGCATMIRGTKDSLQVSSEPTGALVELSDGQKGTTTCQFTCARNQSMLVKISKEGYHPETVTVYPTLAGAGVILGGLIDYGTGAVYNLTPNPVHVVLKPKESERPERGARTSPPPDKPKINPDHPSTKSEE